MVNIQEKHNSTTCQESIEARQLLQYIVAGGHPDKDQEFYDKYKGLVRKIVKDFYSKSVKSPTFSFEDCEAEAWKAVFTKGYLYHPGKGRGKISVFLSTIILGHLKRVREKTLPAVHTPTYMYQKFTRINQFISKFSKEYARVPSISEIVKCVPNVTEKDYLLFKDWIQESKNLDDIANYCPATANQRPDHQVMDNIATYQFQRAIAENPNFSELEKKFLDFSLFQEMNDSAIKKTLCLKASDLEALRAKLMPNVQSLATSLLLS